MLGLGAALLVLLCFFFPWIELNPLFASANLSGFQLATGSGPAGSSPPAVPILFLVPLSMIGVLVIVAVCFLGQSSAEQLKSIAGLLLIVAGGFSTLLILYQYFSLNQQFNQDVLGMIAQKMFSYSFGAHLSLLGSLVVAVGGLLDLIKKTMPVGSYPEPMQYFLSRPKALAIFGRDNEGFHHLGIHKVAVELVQLPQPEVIAGIV
jgi:hypothetical protein